MIAAWSVDRLGRSLRDLVGFLNELHALERHLYLRQRIPMGFPEAANRRFCGLPRKKAT